MADNVINWGGTTTAPIPAENILRQAIDADLDMVIVVGADRDGNLYFAGNRSEVADINLCLDAAKAQVLEMIGPGE